MQYGSLFKTHLCFPLQNLCLFDYLFFFFQWEEMTRLAKRTTLMMQQVLQQDLYQNSIVASLIFADKQIQPLCESSSLMGVKMLVQETVSLARYASNYYYVYSFCVILRPHSMYAIRIKSSKGRSNSQNELLYIVFVSY